jgi:hypothetical protein
MSRWIAALLLAGAAPLVAQQANPPQGELKKERPKPTGKVEYEAPPEEDKDTGVIEYSFNPLQSEKDVRVGNWYLKQRNFHAAVMRYREATKWNDGNSEAWLRLAEAAEKTKDSPLVKQAYLKYLALEPQARNAPEIRKKIEKLK